MVSSLRRLAADHAALHNSELPPNYLFPADETSADDLTQLAILLTGPQGTPYSQGLWRLQLKMPEDYPKSPPKASFKTRIWHPNVEELTGAVCVDTLKRDWKPSLTLRDVLVTISCLLIYPNPDSALNSAAGAMLQEDYDAFARQARLMTSIHAPVPAELKDAVMEAKLRGEDAGTVVKEQEIADSRSVRSRTETRVSSLTMKASRSNNKGRADSQSQSQHDGYMQQEHHGHDHNTIAELSDSEEINDENENGNENMSGASKENNPSLSPSPVKFASPSPRKYPHGKRPLSVLEMPFPADSDIPMLDTDNTDQQGMTASEKNIAANTNADPTTARDPILLPQRKSPKLTNSMLFSSHHTATIASSSRAGTDIGIYEDTPHSDTHSSLHYRSTRGNSNGRRNSSSASKGYNHPMNMPIPVLRSQSGHDISLSSTGSGSSIPISSALPSSSRVSSSSNSKLISASRKMMMPSMTAFSTSSTSSANCKRTKPRIGIRRL